MDNGSRHSGCVRTRSRLLPIYFPGRNYARDPKQKYLLVQDVGSCFNPVQAYLEVVRRSLKAKDKDHVVADKEELVKNDILSLFDRGTSLTTTRVLDFVNDILNLVFVVLYGLTHGKCLCDIPLTHIGFCRDVHMVILSVTDSPKKAITTSYSALTPQTQAGSHSSCSKFDLCMRTMTSGLETNMNNFMREYPFPPGHNHGQAVKWALTSSPEKMSVKYPRFLCGNLTSEQIECAVDYCSQHYST
ncbi:hypothetical protein CHS0354_034180 [Potamilus streckersoni]|uniref:Uncharacterized protein n=1 Tax=Potamilus streckersoni TaxID=2493646 RepID=A0AAE0RNQ4_9BIVA|nr:hypothetical protein CHS0354_034180 [Potamilus streckersoni]